MLIIKVQRWSDFQHYRRRRPPWIKLYVRLLDDRQFRELTPFDRCLLEDIWLLASADGGTLKTSVTDLTWRLRIEASLMLARLVALSQVVDTEKNPKWLTISATEGELTDNASTELARSEHHAQPETETETETEKRHPAGDPTGNGALVPVSRETANGKHPRTHGEIVQHLGSVLGDVLNGTRDRLKAEEVRNLKVLLIFAYWQSKANHPSALLDPKRERRITARLKENFDNVDELLFVVDGLLRDKNLMGANERNQVYDGIETIFRDRGQVERLAKLGGHAEGKKHPMAERLEGIS